MLRRVGIGLAILLVGLLVIIVGLAGSAQTGPGQRLIVRSLNAALGGTVEVRGLSGSIPFDLHLDRLALIEDGEPWLEVEDLTLDWSASRLLDGVVAIHRLTARQIEVRALPEGGTAEPEVADAAPFQLPELPDSLPLVVLDELEVDTLVLHEPVLGERAVFHIEGHASTTDRGRALEVALEVARTDRATARAGLNATLALDPPTLNLDFRAEERGRLVERLAGLEESGDFTVRLTGNGPLRAWRGELEAGGAGIGDLDGSVTLALVDQPRLGVQLALRPSDAILPDDVEALLEGPLDLALDVTQTGAQQIRIHELAATSGAAALGLEGTFDFDARQFDARARLGLPALAALEGLAGTPLAGDATLRLDARGAFLRPAGRLELGARDLEAAEARVAELSAGLDFEALADLDQSPALALALAGEALGVELPESVGLPRRDLTFRAAGRRPPGAEAVIETARIGDGNLTLELTGTADPEALAAALDLRLVVDRLAELTTPLGQEIAGRLEVAGPVRVIEGAARIETDLTAAIEALGGLPPDLAALAGDRLEARLEAAVEPGNTLRIDALELENRTLTASGEGRLGLVDGTIEAALALGLRDLAALQPLAGTELAGRLALTAEASGTLEAPKLTLTAGGDDLTLAGRPVRQLQLTADAAGLEPTAGRVRLGLVMPRLEATLSSGYRLEDQLLVLSDTRLEGTGVELEGEARTDLASGLTTGRFDGGVAELGRLDALLPVPLRGRIDLELRLEEQAGGQAVAAAATAREVRGPFGGLERATLQAELSDVLAAPELQATLAVTGFRRETVRIERLEAEASGTFEELTIDFSGEGSASEPFDLEGTTVLALGEATRVQVTRLDGTFARQPLALRGPATLALNDPAIELSGLDLSFAGGRLRADAALGPGPVSGLVTLDGLRLQNLRTLGVPPLRGAVQAELRLDGVSNDPNLALELRIPNLRAADATLGDVPPLDVALDATLAGRRLEARLRASGVTDAPITGRLAAPVLLDLEHFALELPDGGALDGGLDAAVRLERISDLLVLDGQRLEGLLNAELALGGTVGAPEVDGRITLDDGRYENGTTGTVLRGITLRAEATADRFAITELRATDGGRGRLSGTGRIDLDPAQNYPLQAEVALRNAVLLRRDDVEATLGGTLRLAGDLQRSTLGGRVVIEEAEVGLPERSGGPDVAVLDVEEVGAGITPEEAGGEAAEADERVVALDLTIQVPGRFYVRGRGLESEWQGRLEVEGTLDEPRLVGDLAIKRGYFDFIDRRFELREGEIQFTGALPPVPEITIEAVAETDEVTAIVRASGTPGDLEITLGSEPELPEDEVLSRLLFNRDVSSISAAEAASLAVAVNRLRGGSGGFDVLGRAREALGVDTLEVGGPQGEEAVRAGKYLSDDVYVEVEQGRGEKSGRARVELEVLPNVSIEADTGDDARSGVGVNWRYDF